MSLNFCPKCGAKVVKQKNKFCSFCGAELIDLAETKWKKVKDLLCSSTIILLSEIATILNVDKSVLANKFEKKRIEKVVLEQNFIKIESGANPVLLTNFFNDTVRFCTKCNKRATGNVLKFCKDCGISLLPKETAVEITETKIPLPYETISETIVEEPQRFKLGSKEYSPSEMPKMTFPSVQTSSDQLKVASSPLERELSKEEQLTNFFLTLREGNINITELANIIKVQRIVLMRKLLDFRTQVEFKLDGDYVKINHDDGEKLKDLLRSNYSLD